MVQVWYNSSKTLNESYIDHAILRHLKSTYVIEKPFSFTSIINDMKRIYSKIFKSNKPSLGSLHGPGPLTAPSTLTSSGTTGLGLMPSIPSFDSDGTASAGVSVRV